jgi:hypothetical protein
MVGLHSNKLTKLSESKAPVHEVARLCQSPRMRVWVWVAGGHR